MFGEINFATSRVPGVSDDDCNIDISYSDGLGATLKSVSHEAEVFLCLGPEPSVFFQCLAESIKSTRESDLIHLGEIVLRLTSEKFSAVYNLHINFSRQSKQLFMVSEKEIPGEAASELAIDLIECLQGVKCFNIVKCAENQRVEEPFIEHFCLEEGEIKSSLLKNDRSCDIDSNFMEGLSAAFLTIFAADSECSISANAYILHKPSFLFCKQLVSECLQKFAKKNDSILWSKTVDNFSARYSKQFDNLYL